MFLFVCLFGTALLDTYILSFIFLLSKVGVEQEILVFWINIRIVAAKQHCIISDSQGQLAYSLPEQHFQSISKGKGKTDGTTPREPPHLPRCQRTERRARLRPQGLPCFRTHRRHTRGTAGSRLVPPAPGRRSSLTSSWRPAWWGTGS